MSKEKTYTIGRSRNCHIVLADDTVSKEHAQISLTGERKIFLTDTGSRNGTYLLKGKEFRKIQKKTHIVPGDTVKFGECEMVVGDILDDLRRREVLPIDVSSKPDKPDGKVERCDYCGAIKEIGQICPECGQ